MTMRTIAGCGLAIGLFALLSACAPGFYPPYPPYYARPAYSYAPSRSATRAQERREAPQSSTDWINPEPVR
jgi:hypothetical protein